jgi:multisubunit Na+/H+ antiporter MnhG subunit
MTGNKNNDDVRMLSLFVGMMASIFWIFLVILFPDFYSSRGEIMPFDRWIIIAAGLVGAVASFFGAVGIVRGIARLADRFRKGKAK